ncbi:MAG: transporter [Desulfobacterium sp.]|nr:transporter [Desulfobacterium sp.]
MKKGLCYCFLLFTVSLIWSSSSRASGFALYENSPTGAAVAGAFAATADDPSAVWYNPAGITQLDGTQIMTGFTTYTTGGAKLEFENGPTSNSVDDIVPVPYFYASTKINEKFWFGLGMFSPFGLSAEYEKDWEGRYNTYYSANVAKELNPNIVYKVNDSLSVGFGVSVQQFEVEFQQKINSGVVYQQGKGLTAEQAAADPLFNHLKGIDIDQKLFADENAEFRYNLSLFYTMNEKWSFGLNYRSEVDYTLKGDANYANIPAPFSTQIYNAAISGDVTLPQVLWTGIAYKASPKLTLEVDLVMTGWSSYQELKFKLDNGLGTQTVEKNWDDVYSIRFGADYQMTDAFAVRCGYLFDESPIPDSSIDYAMPSSDRHMFSAGFGYKFGNWTVDSHYAYVTITGERDIDARPVESMYINSRVKEAVSHQFGMSLSYMF